MGSWKVRIIREAGEIHELMREKNRYKWDIIGLSETKWENYSKLTDEGHKIIDSGNKRFQQHGVAFIVRNELSSGIINYIVAFRRIISLMIAFHLMNLSIIHIFSSTIYYEDDAIEELYEEIEVTIAKDD